MFYLKFLLNAYVLLMLGFLKLDIVSTSSSRPSSSYYDDCVRNSNIVRYCNGLVDEYPSNLINSVLISVHSTATNYKYTCISQLCNFLVGNNILLTRNTIDSLNAIYRLAVGKTYNGPDLVWLFLTSSTPDFQKTLLNGISKVDYAIVPIENRKIEYLFQLQTDISTWKNLVSTKQITSQSVHDLLWCPNIFFYFYNVYNGSTCQFKHIMWILMGYCTGSGQNLIQPDVDNFNYLAESVCRELNEKFRHEVVNNVIQTCVSLNIGELGIKVVFDQLNTKQLKTMGEAEDTEKIWDLKKALSAAKRTCITYNGNSENDKDCIRKWINIATYNRNMSISSELIMSDLPDGTVDPFFNKMREFGLTGLELTTRILSFTQAIYNLSGGFKTRRESPLSTQIVYHFYYIGHWRINDSLQDAIRRLEAITTVYNSGNRSAAKTNTIKHLVDSYFEDCRAIMSNTDYNYSRCLELATDMYNTDIRSI